VVFPCARSTAGEARIVAPATPVFKNVRREKVMCVAPWIRSFLEIGSRPLSAVFYDR
jgi:hypothetical protein